MDQNLSMKQHVEHICRGAWFHLRKIRQIRSYLNNDTAERLIHAYVSSKLDFTNCLFYGLPSTLLDKLRRIQNAAARIVRRIPKHQHITPVLKDLHWLPIPLRIEYKLLLFVYKSLKGIAPEYISDILTIQKNAHELRSSSKHLLVIPKARTVTYGERSFIYAAAKLWNSLPEDVKASGTVISFKSSLKTHLFAKAFKR